MARLTPLAGLGILCVALLGCSESSPLPATQNGSGGASGSGAPGGEADAAASDGAQDLQFSPQDTSGPIDVHPTPDSAAGVCPQTAAPESPCTPVGLECTGYITPIVSCRCTERIPTQPVWTCIALLY
ncbi:MAG: hypothetical protein QOI66_3885 [Myxococcales bacterium]|nr:hypothetical protein [Myxococcales bacterium]